MTIGKRNESTIPVLLGTLLLRGVSKVTDFWLGDCYDRRGPLIYDLSSV
jgi:hypothetical protein